MYHGKMAGDLSFCRNQIEFSLSYIYIYNYIYIYINTCTCCTLVQLGRTKSVQRICDPYTLKTDLEEGKEVIH